MSRRNQWSPVSPSEVVDLAVSMAGDLDSGASMTGETPTVSVWEKSGGNYTAASGFTVASAQVNTGALTAADGSTIAIGEGISFRLTAGAAGTYYIRSECDADDGTHPVRYDRLVVEGPPSS